MNKAELIEAISDKTNFTKKDVTAMLDAYNETITKALKKGDKVQLIGFGTYEVSKRAARAGKNPRTGEALKIPACKVPKFKPGKALKDAVNKK